MWVLWPAFLAACALELLVFALVDPMDLVGSGQPPGWTRQGVQSAAFFTFWLVAAGACALTVLLRDSDRASDAEEAAPKPLATR